MPGWPKHIPSFTISGAPVQSPTKTQTYNLSVASTIGKTLSFDVYYEESGNPASLRSKSGNQPFTFAEGTWTWYLQVYECDAQGNRIPDQTPQTTGKYSLTVDTTPPNGSFAITSTDGKKDLSLVPTNTENVRMIPKISMIIRDCVHSGVKGFYLWNGSSGGDQPIDNAPPDSANLITDLLSPINWTLPAGDGQKFVMHMLVVDNVINATLITVTIVLDKTPPDAPAGFSYSRSADRKSIDIKWSSKTSDGQATDITKFFGNIFPGRYSRTGD